MIETIDQAHDYSWSQPVCTRCGFTVRESLQLTADTVPPCPVTRRRHCRSCGTTEWMTDPDSDLCVECWGHFEGDGGDGLDV